MNTLKTGFAPPGRARAAMETLQALCSSSFWVNWFKRPSGGWEILRVSAPIIVSSATFALMNFADRLFLTWYDQREMSAAFQAGCLMWLLTTFPTAIAAFTNAFVSQYNGAKQYEKIGENVWQGVYFGLASGLLFIVATPLIAPFYRFLGATPDLAQLSQDYWFYVSLAASAAIAQEGFTAYFCGRKDMKTVMWVGIGAVLVNTALDPLFIFGVNGHLRWGVKGAAIASALALWFKFFVYLYLALKRDKTWRCGLREHYAPRLCEMWRLLRFGGMSAFQVTAENACYTLIVLLMNRYGDAPSQGAAIAFNLDALCFMPMVGLGVATTALVGNQVGANRYDLASRVVATAFTLSMAYTSLFVVSYLSAPNFFLDLYARNDPETFEEIRSVAVFSLRFISVCLFFDTMNTVVTASLRGAGDARFIMNTTFVIAAVTIVALVLGTYVWNFSYRWLWYCMGGYVTLNANTFLIRFFQGGWKKHRLIEESAGSTN